MVAIVITAYIYLAKRPYNILLFATKKTCWRPIVTCLSLRCLQTQLLHHLAPIFIKVLLPFQRIYKRPTQNNAKIIIYIYKKNLKYIKYSNKCNRSLLRRAIFYHNVILWTAPSLPNKEKKLNRTKHNNEGFKTLWLQVASKGLSPNDNLRHVDISLDFSFFFHSLKLVFIVRARVVDRSDKSQTGTTTERREVTEVTTTMSYSLHFWVKPYLQTHKL